MMELYYDCCFAGGLRIAVMLSYLSWNYRKAVMLQGVGDRSRAWIEKRWSHNLNSGPLTMWPAEF